VLQYKTWVQKWRKFLPQTDLSGYDDRLSSVNDLKLTKDAGDVIPNGLITDHEFFGNLAAVCRSLNHNLDLLCCDLVK
jgi:hypothetical protein